MTTSIRAGQQAVVGSRVRVWDAPTRLFHWAIVILVATSWVTAESGFITVHSWSGAALMALVIFRLVWGLVGSTTSRFSNFIASPRRVVGYARELMSGTEPCAPWSFDNCHKIAMDPRYKPARILCTDRNHDRLVHMDLNGRVIGNVAVGLRAPGAVAVYRNELAVAECSGRISILGLHGEVLATIGANDNAKEVYTNEVPPEKWQNSLFYAPHGITYDSAGNVLVTEWSKWGRVIKMTRASSASE